MLWYNLQFGYFFPLALFFNNEVAKRGSVSEGDGFFQTATIRGLNGIMKRLMLALLNPQVMSNLVLPHWSTMALHKS